MEIGEKSFLVGDDVVIADSGVAKCYEAALSELGVIISHSFQVVVALSKCIPDGVSRIMLF